METRWTRLERYARWKQQRVRLDALPPDVLCVVCRFLSNDGVSSLLAALRGEARVQPVRSTDDVRWVPVEIRQSWLRRIAYDHLRTQLRSLASHTCLFSNDATLQVHAFADWSPFKKRSRVRRPIAEYFYTTDRPEWIACVNECTLVEHVDNLFRRRVCGTRVGLYVVFSRGGMMYVFPREVSCAMLLVYPHYLLNVL